MFQLFRKSLLFLVLPAALVSCSDDSAEKTCDTPFLDKINGEKVYYYESGLVSTLPWGSETAFFYSETGKPVEIRTPAEDLTPWDRLYLFYDGNDRMDYGLRFRDGEKVDSIQATYDAQQRIIKLAYYAPTPSPESIMAVHLTVEYEYEGMNPTNVWVHYADGSLNTITIEYDNHPLPFPPETRMMALLSNMPLNLGVNNATRYTYTFEDSESSYTEKFTYSKNGYPVKLTSISQEIWFSYACNPTVE